jgi:hypothetical protein
LGRVAHLVSRITHQEFEDQMPDSRCRMPGSIKVSTNFAWHLATGIWYQELV